MTRLTKLYHAHIGIPRDVELPTIGAALYYSTHAHREAIRDGVQKTLPRSLPGYDLIEVETFAGRAAKWVVRFSVTLEADLVMVLTRDYLVKTVWVNLKRDQHETLNRTHYEQPTEGARV